MNRRDFVKAGLLTAAAATNLDLSSFAQSQAGGTYAEGQKLTLANKYLEWELVMTGDSIESTGVRNKISDRYYDLSDAQEFLITLSGAKARVEIPWWNFEIGPDNDDAPPDGEHGYREGYHLENFSGDREWKKTLTLALRGSLSVETPPVFNGYGWFRQKFSLPKNGEGESITFCLGGYNQEDWNQYWAYVNGKLVGHWKNSGHWRKPEELTLNPGSGEYAALRFGADRENSLAVRTYQYDKHFGGLSDEILDRFTFEGLLVDQFIAVGRAYIPVSQFKLTGWGQEGQAERPHYSFHLANSEQELQLTVHYELDQFMRRKWFEIRNVGKEDRLLLDVCVDNFHTASPMTEGDYGYPVIIGEEMFCVVEHPCGLNQGMSGQVRLRHFPGKKLAAGESLSSRVSVFGVGPSGGGRLRFLEYLEGRTPRKKKFVSVYSSQGINGFPDSPCWSLNDDQMLDMMELMEKWQTKGVKFDYFVVDVGWADRTSDLTRYLPNCFPDGPEKVIKRANQLGMQWGLWFSGTSADWSIGLNPNVEPSRAVPPGGEWPQYLYRDGFAVDDLQRRELCLASEPHFSILRDALLYHIKNSNMKYFELDSSRYYCNSTEHGHLPGKYSAEANLDAVIELARVTRQACPDIYTVWWWGISSPLSLLYGDALFEKRLHMEAVSTGDYPALFFRDAVDLALDEGTQFAEFIPPTCLDSLGVWITDTAWGNAMNKERWREEMVMDLGRGHMMFPHLWSNLYILNDEDVSFLARIQALAKRNEAVFSRQYKILGNPWKGEVYGYAYFQGAHGFLFMNNLNFQSRPVRLRLDETMGLRAPTGAKLKILSHFPDQEELRNRGQAALSGGGTLNTWLRPFEVAMWEVVLEGAEGTPKGLPIRVLPAERPDIESHLLELEEQAVRPEMEIEFADITEPALYHFRSTRRRPSLKELQDTGFKKRIIPRRGSIPSAETRGCTLAIVIRLRRNGKWWRYQQPVDLIQIQGSVGDQAIRFEAVPNLRQTENNQWAPWLVFKTRMNPGWSNKKLAVAINAYLPPDVECQLEGWVVPRWWEKT